MSVSQAAKIDDQERIEALKRLGVRHVRLQFADLHGVCRGKVFPIGEFLHRAREGIAFVSAVMTCDLRHHTLAGFDQGLSDMLARPDLGTLVQVPWEPEVAWCVADLEHMKTRTPYAVDPRGALRDVVAAYRSIGLTPVVGPELEFYLCGVEAGPPKRLSHHVAHDSRVYTVGPCADPGGLLERLMDHCVDMGLGAFAANHEYGRGQYEINLTHSPALDSADRAFRFKTLIKEVAAREGLTATFMGKPFNDDEGSGLHLHLSIQNEGGENALYDSAHPEELTEIGMHFVAGVLHRARALMAFLNPTVNAYRRTNMKTLAPSHVNWGYDNRFTFVRIPHERGEATRVEVRVGDGTANPYIAYTALLLAGLEGIKKKMVPPPPLSGMIYDLPEEDQGPPLPLSLDEAMACLREDDFLPDAVGRELVDAFMIVKDAELDRYRQWVSDWEIDEYAHHL